MVGPLEDQIRQIAAHLRVGATAEGNERFTAFTDDLGQALASGRGNMKALVHLLRKALEMHERGDYIGLADALEHELLPGLKSLR